jgi:GcrA cell cycle regulator
MDWNDERTAALKQMWLEGMSASQVARQLGGVSRNAVIGKVHRLGLNSRAVPSRPRSLGGRPAGSARPRNTVVQARRAGPAAAPTPTPRPAPARLAVRVFDPDVAPTASLLTLTPEACRWPIGDPAEAGFGFCGRDRDGSGPYCEGHANAGLRRKRTEAAVQAEVEYWLRQSTGAGRRAPSHLPGR